jgi:6-pyruvoyltetrahydropterin/6-carboxytetrahydropterin synthase
LHFVRKTYGHDLGLSACFRQWRAKSHCRFLHGYPLSFTFTFAASELDENGWVIDFGSLKPVKQWLCDTFDHKLLVATDDPQRARLADLNRSYGVTIATGSVADVLVVPAVGCEAFAKMAWDYIQVFLDRNDYLPRVALTEIEVREHGANGVVYTGEC